MNKQKGFSIIEFLIIIIIVSSLIFPIIFSIIGIHRITGNGTHVGYITAISTHGLFFPTSRAYVKTDIQSSQENSYCVIDKSLMPILKDFADKKEKVEVTFFSYVSAGVSNCNGEGDIISSVRELP